MRACMRVRVCVRACVYFCACVRTCVVCSLVIRDDDNSLGLRSTTDASLINLALKHYRYRASSPPVLPGPNLTITPWADALQMSEGPLKLELEAEQNMVRLGHRITCCTANMPPI